jgi:hypothetical protein
MTGGELTQPRPLLTTETPLAELRHWCEVDPSDVVPRGLHALACARDGLGPEACPYPPEADAARRAWRGVYRTACDIALKSDGTDPPSDTPAPDTPGPDTLPPDTLAPDTLDPAAADPDTPVQWWQRY